jgi:hypothetical protein
LKKLVVKLITKETARFFPPDKWGEIDIQTNGSIMHIKCIKIVNVDMVLEKFKKIILGPVSQKPS